MVIGDMPTSIRMNGYFSDIPNSRKNIESQLMATMLKQLCSFDCELPDIMAEKWCQQMWKLILIQHIPTALYTIQKT